MNHSTKLMSLFGVGAVILVGMAGCTKEAAESTGEAVEGAGKAISNTTDAAGNQVKGAGNALDNAADATGNALDNAGKAAGNAVDATGNAVKAGVGKLNTPKLKALISANPVGKNIKDLNVDTSGDTITLTGTGSNAAKTAAGQIAKKEAIGYKIVNNIKTQ